MKGADVPLKWRKSSRKELARKRWNILAEVLFTRKWKTFTPDDTESIEEEEEEDGNVDGGGGESGRVNGSGNFFDIFSITPLKGAAAAARSRTAADNVSSSSSTSWYRYRLKLDDVGEDEDKAEELVEVKICHSSKHFTVEELTGFNNTGNVRIWPSEQILAYMCVKNRRFFRGKRVLEVGGGMSCLAGVLVAYFAPECVAVHVTDGNATAVRNVEKIVKENSRSRCPLTWDVLVWSEYAKHSTTYDVILAADCLFFDECRTDLIRLAYSLLKEDGAVLIAAPRRGDTLLKFMNETGEAGFASSVYYRYDEIIWSQHLKLAAEREDYVEDLHYPLFLVLEKRSSLSSRTSTFKNVLWRN